MASVRLRQPAEELSARDVCCVLQPLFPERVVSLALLNHYKTHCGIVPQGRENDNLRRSSYYTLNDVIALAAALDLNDIGIPACVVPKLLKRLQDDVPANRCGVIHRDKRYSVSYDHRPMAKAVREHWNALIKEQSGG